MSTTCRSTLAASLVSVALGIMPAWGQEARPNPDVTLQPASTSVSKSREVLTAEFESAKKHVRQLYREKQYAKAAIACEKALELAVGLFGPSHPTTAQAMHDLAGYYSKTGQHPKAESMYVQSLKIREAKLNKNHPSIAMSLNCLAGLYKNMGQYAKAEPLFLRGLTIREATLGKDHFDVAKNLNNLALLYSSMGRYTKAKPLYLRSLKIREAKLGKSHMSVAICLNNLASLYRDVGEYAKAEPLYLRSLEIREAKLGKDAISVANCLRNLALLYYYMDEYAKAEPLCLRSLKILEAKLGKDHPYVETCLNNLAHLYCSMNEYAKAEQLYLRNLKVNEMKLGKDHPNVARSLSGLAGVYKDMGEYAKAEPLFLRSLKIREAKQGKNHPDIATVLHNLAKLYFLMEQHTKAEPLYLRSLEIREAKLGKNHTDVAKVLHSLAKFYSMTDQHAKAEPLYLRGLKIDEAKLGKDHPFVAMDLHDLARLYQRMGQYAKAEPLFLRSLKIQEAKRPPNFAHALDNLGVLYKSVGQYSKAEQLHLRSLKIREARLGKDHLDVATSLNRLATVYELMGQYAKAEPLFQQSLKIREAKLGKDHTEVSLSLNNLALMYHHMGQYAKAESLYLRSFATKAPEDHRGIATGLNNLAMFYEDTGQYAKAKPLHLRSLKIREVKLGKDHLDVAQSLHNLAILHQRMGEYAKAEPLHLRSLKITETKLGKDHPDVAGRLIGLAGVYAGMGEYAKAEPLFLRSLKITETKLGKDHPEVSYSLINLALLYNSMGKHANIEPLLLRGLKIWEVKLGKNHPYVASGLFHLAGLYCSMGQYTKAEPLAHRAMEIYLQSRSLASHGMLGKASFHGKHAHTGDLAVCLGLKIGKTGDSLELLERGRVLGLRELLSEAKARSSGVLDEADGRRISGALAKINALNAALERQAKKGRPTKLLQETIKQAERNYDQLLVELGERHQQFVAAETTHAVTSRQVAKSPAIDDETAIVGWVWHGEWRWGYVIRRTGVKWVDLSKGFDRDAQVRLRRQILTATRTPATSRLLPADLHRMYRESLAPLEMHLKGISKLIVIAQDWPAYLPVEMLLTEKPSTDDGNIANWAWLDTKYRISYAPSCTTLDILCKQRAKRKARQWARPLFVLADPPFSTEQLARMESEKDSPIGQLLASADSGKRSNSMLTRMLRFDAKAMPSRLPGTRLEARMIADLLGSKQSLLLLGPDASERKLFEASKSGKLKQCRYIHLATHGFADSNRPEFSGLALARVPADKDYDGILHMREVFQLKLDADLVVLSACQTGMGKHLSGEGMLGLSTAFFFAGTRSIVMSVWNVPDAPTALLMHRFYSNLKTGKTKAAALREAKNWLRKLTRDDLKKLGQADPTIAQLTRGFQVTTSPKGRQMATKPFAHPHYWAGFILTGDPQ